ncbi:hypothetical protein F3Y22_tig00110813pilonHSYRG00143 [Hibiscus syriacus]|uniref:Uncharacterized protein n=1 Tax=Hibiscus syriacus TaxID=106335 RepID=A0A6A2ZMT2_HIBSY|nr:hypothetical protein F3Y22_tig00110813pilonHSYRG00143 [Hibiscus syriacus]
MRKVQLPKPLIWNSEQYFLGYCVQTLSKFHDFFFSFTRVPNSPHEHGLPACAIVVMTLPIVSSPVSVPVLPLDKLLRLLTKGPSLVQQVVRFMDCWL